MRTHLVRGTLALLLGLSVASCRDVAPTAAPVHPAGPRFNVAGTQVVISQVYGGGGNAGATYKNDFIELYNPTANDISLSGWSVQYASATGTSWSVTALSGTLAAGHYYLVQEAVGAGGTTNLPTPDATGSIAMSATVAKVALVNSTTALSGACPTGASILDFVGYGTGTGGANCFEGSGAAATLTNTTAALRGGAGCTDTDNNAADFTSGAPTPRNTSAATHTCGVATPVVTSVTVAPDPASVFVGATQTFTAAAFDASHNTVASTFTWSSSDPTIATIDATGTATGVATGTVTITAKTPNNVSATATLTVSTAPNVAGTVVVSQVYGGGGNSGATYKNDYIELYNRSAQPVNLAGWSVQYASAAGSFTQSTPLSGTIQPGAYLLVQEASGGSTGATLPTADVTGSINLSATSGKVLLAQTAAALGSACPTGTLVVDFVGFGSSASCFEGSGPTPAPSNTTAALRRGEGSQDTNDNSDDFDAGAPNPRNKSYVPPTPGALDHVTIAGATKVNVGSPVQLSAVAKDANNVTVSGAAFTWSSSDPSRATVDQTGKVTAVTPGGFATISATTTVGGVTKVGTSTLVVSQGGSVSVSARTVPLPVGFQTQLFASEGGVSLSLVTWASSDPNVLTVDANGVITATGVGSATIAAFKPDGSGNGTTVTTEAQLFDNGARTGHNTEFGVPTDNDPSNDVLITRKQYTISYNPQRGGPNWVSWDLSATHVGGADRCNCFTADTALTRVGIPAYTTNDFISGGLYDRGHMEPSADQTTTDTENGATFFLTNVLPQKHDLNAGPWEKLEIALRDSVKAGREVYQVAGGIFTGGVGLGSLNNAGKIYIPDSTWKIAVLLPAGKGLADVTSASDVDVIAVNMPNVAGIAGDGWEQYKTTVAKIQKSTGYDFLSALPERIQCQVEVRNCPPTGHITSAISAGGWKTTEGQTVSFDASTSTDPDDDALSYMWTVDAVTKGIGPTLNYTFARHGTYQLRLIVADQAGAADTATVDVVVLNVPPSVNTFSGATIDEGGSYTASGSFADPGDETWTATVDYGDGSGAQPLTLSGKSFSLSHTYADNGSYTVTVTVTEADLPMAAGSNTATVTVNNVAPAVNAFSGGSIDEGGTYTASGSFTDPGDDSWSATVDYGDGSGPQPLALSGKTFSLSHTYADNGSYTVKVTVTETDPEHAAGSSTATVNVANVAPTVDAFAGATILRGETYTSGGTFGDPGSDTWSATVNYGDGSGTSALALSGKAFSLHHTYAAAGTFTVKVTVTDDDGGSGPQTAQVQVLSPGGAVQTLTGMVDALAAAGKMDPNDAKFLDNKLGVAASELAKGNNRSAVNQLQDVIARIAAAQSAGRLSSADAAALTAYANRIIASIGG